MFTLPFTLLLAAALPQPAAACESLALGLRDVLPRADQEGLPLDTRIVLPLIGLGSEGEVGATLEANGSRVEVTEEEWCYDHEGPHERHCWLSLVPIEDLQADTKYEIVIQSSDSYQGEEPIRERTKSGLVAATPTSSPRPPTSSFSTRGWSRKTTWAPATSTRFSDTRSR